MAYYDIEKADLITKLYNLTVIKVNSNDIPYEYKIRIQEPFI
ncbi:hypothetical protein SDC9_124718 [bioreactor metagenome]|uniref:Uncharacterized protein n=1 Tax=bioreactor metagenome TaxID=1076179 RepID=A0A645CL37_9ZZZZ